MAETPAFRFELEEGPAQRARMKVVGIGVHHLALVDGDILPPMRRQKLRQQAEECLIFALTLAQFHGRKPDLEWCWSQAVSHHGLPQSDLL